MVGGNLLNDSTNRCGHVGLKTRVTTLFYQKLRPNRGSTALSAGWLMSDDLNINAMLANLTAR